jgi:hypothetical protein
MKEQAIFLYEFEKISKKKVNKIVKLLIVNFE